MTDCSIRVKPTVDAVAVCHECGQHLVSGTVLWAGIHVCTEYECTECGSRFIEDLPVGHAVGGPFRIDIHRNQLTGPAANRAWFGEPLFRALLDPDESEVRLVVEIRKPAPRIVLLNCIDSLYGHCVLKLLNAAAHLADPEYGVVVLVPSFLVWMIPDGVAEVWCVEMPLSLASNYFPDLHRAIERELTRFLEVRVSRAYSHPSQFRLADFTRIARHDFSKTEYRLTFIWRADRLWLRRTLVTRVFKRLGLERTLLAFQRRRIRKLFKQVGQDFPEAKLTVAGIGRQGRFPQWIDDLRVDRINSGETERSLCRIYSESRVVVGVHGSNMLLPSGHAGMCVDLMPEERWPNIAQDILYAPEDFHGDVRMSAYRHRFVSLDTSPREVGTIIAGMLGHFQGVLQRFVSEMRDPHADVHR